MDMVEVWWMLAFGIYCFDDLVSTTEERRRKKDERQGVVDDNGARFP